MFFTRRGKTCRYFKTRIEEHTKNSMFVSIYILTRHVLAHKTVSPFK